MAAKPKLDITDAFNKFGEELTKITDKAQQDEANRNRVVDDPFTPQDYKRLVDEIGEKAARRTLRSQISDKDLYTDDAFGLAMDLAFDKKDWSSRAGVSQQASYGGDKFRNGFIDDQFKDHPLAFTNEFGLGDGISTATLFEQGSLIRGGDKTNEAKIKTAAGLRRREAPLIGQESGALKATQRQRAQQQGARQEGVGTSNSGLLEPASLARKRLTRNRFLEAGGA